jgi:putative flavoprotein involved in K+ transport
MHAAEYRNPAPAPGTGQRIIVIGAGNSAVQIAVELAQHAKVSLATRAPIRFTTPNAPRPRRRMATQPRLRHHPRRRA